MSFYILKNKKLSFLTKHPLFSLALKFISYSLLGGIGLIVDLSVFYFLSHVIPITLAVNTISVSAGILTSFYLNRKFTFKKLNKPIQRAIKFYVVGILGLLLSNIIIYLLTTYFIIPPFISKLLTLPFVLIFQFAANYLWSFGK